MNKIYSIVLLSLAFSYTGINAVTVSECSSKRKMPRWILKAMDVCGLANKDIDDTKGLKKLGIECADSSYTVEKLDLSGNKLKKIGSEALGAWSFVTSLNVASNELVILPDLPAECDFDKLECFDLSRNQVICLPDWLMLCPKLQVVDISRNKFTEFPLAFNLGNSKTSIHTLNIAHNFISVIPATITEMTGLKVLVLGDGGTTATQDDKPLVMRLPQEFASMADQLEIICIGGVTFDESSRELLADMGRKNTDLIIHKGTLQALKESRRKHNFSGGHTGGGGAVC